MKRILLSLLFIISCLFLTKDAFALTFDLIAPSGQLQSGQDVKFTINIDTEGKSYSSTQIGMTYDTQFLEYVSTSVGNTFTTVSADPQAGGKIIISGSSTAGYSGSGVYAYVTFKIIAASPGSTQLCALFNPEVTPTSPPSVPTSTPVPGVPTSPPNVPTALPTSGDINGVGRGLTLGLVFLILAGGGFFVFRNL